MKIKLLRCFVLLICFQGLMAQTKIIGRVTDKNGETIPGVGVLEKGTNNEVATDLEGSYAISVKEGAVLEFYMIGFETQDISTDEKKTINVVLQEYIETIEKVVVIGYGSQKKSDVTGSVASIDAEQIQQLPSISLEQAIAGKVAGVNVYTNSGRPGGNTNIRIRGNNSINSTNRPLYVVDGVIGAGTINYLTPNDIETMEVLKDASATAIYGARGANGVIIVTTKRGSKKGGQLSYDNFVSFSKLTRKLNVLNAQEFLQIEMNSYNNAQKYDPQGWANSKYQNPMTYRNNRKLFDVNGHPLYDTDWQKEATRTAFSQNHNLSFTGGNKKQSYGLFLNYTSSEGIVLESFLDRYSGRFVMDGQVKDWLKVGGGITFNHVKENRIDGGVGGLRPLRMMVEALPIIPVKYKDDTYGSNADYPNMEGGENPVNLLRNIEDVIETQSVLGNVYADITLANGLNLRSTLGTNIENKISNFYSGRTLAAISADFQGEASSTNDRDNYWQFENYLTYKKSFNKNNLLEALAGLGWQEHNWFNAYAGTKGFSDDFYKYYSLQAGANPNTPTSETYKWTMNSYFGRVNYQLYKKYLFTVTGRLDGSSRFGSNNKRAFFPSAAFAWRVSKENFLKGSKTISNLKLRTSYGETGNSEIGQYKSLSTLKSGTAILDGKRAPSVGIDRLANPNLKWERVNQFDAGLNIGLFNNRIKAEADWYYKKTKDMLLNTPVPTSSGYFRVYKNIGSVQNTGFEFTLNTVNITTKDFEWTTDFNLSFNKNKILELGDANDDIFPGPWFLSQTNVLRVGEAVGSFYGLVREGTYQSNEEELAAKYGYKPGDIKHADLNNDGEINDSDRKIIGNAYPDFFGALFNTFRYKSFDLTLDLQYSFGNDVLNLSRHSAEDRTGQANSYATVLDGWTPDHQDTMIVQNRPSRAGYTTTIDTRMVEDGSFIRGRNLILGYNFPKEFLKSQGINRLRIYASLQNFFLITHYTGYDPEVSTYEDAFAQGITFFEYPKPITFTLGININF